MKQSTKGILAILFIILVFSLLAYYFSSVTIVSHGDIGLTAILFIAILGFLAVMASFFFVKNVKMKAGIGLIASVVVLAFSSGYYLLLIATGTPPDSMYEAVAILFPMLISAIWGIKETILILSGNKKELS